MSPFGIHHFLQVKGDWENSGPAISPGRTHLQKIPYSQQFPPLEDISLKLNSLTNELMGRRAQTLAFHSENP